MGRKAKSARALKRKNAKRAMKAARRAEYAGYAGTGANKKSKRFQLGNRRSKNTLKERVSVLLEVQINGRTTLALRTVHKSSARCGNVGCRKPTCQKLTNG